MNAAFGFIWSALNILQIISFMIISKVKLPGVTNELYEPILKIVTFDVVPESIYGPLQEYLFDDLPSDYIFHEKLA